MVVTFNSHFQSNHKQLNTRMCTHTTSVVVKGKISNDTILLSGHPQSTLGYSLKVCCVTQGVLGQGIVEHSIVHQITLLKGSKGHGWLHRHQASVKGLYISL